MKPWSRLFEQTWAYRLLQAPWADAKLEPVLRHNDLGRAVDVLDVGCGPGTNSAFFARQRYVGLDINPAYIEHARHEHAGEFLVADATGEPPGTSYDLVPSTASCTTSTMRPCGRLLANLGRVLPRRPPAL
jgi:SAM-dependent methyltransferase